MDKQKGHCTHCLNSLQHFSLISSTTVWVHKQLQAKHSEHRDIKQGRKEKGICSCYSTAFPALFYFFCTLHDLPFKNKKVFGTIQMVQTLQIGQKTFLAILYCAMFNFIQFSFAFTRQNRRLVLVEQHHFKLRIFFYHSNLHLSSDKLCIGHREVIMFNHLFRKPYFMIIEEQR